MGRSTRRWSCRPPGPGRAARAECQERLDAALDAWRAAGDRALRRRRLRPGPAGGAGRGLGPDAPRRGDRLDASRASPRSGFAVDLPHAVARFTGVSVLHVVAHDPDARPETTPAPAHERAPLGPLSVLAWGGRQRKGPDPSRSGDELEPVAPRVCARRSARRPGISSSQRTSTPASSSARERVELGDRAAPDAPCARARSPRRSTPTCRPAEPDAAARGERRRLRRFGQPEQRAVEARASASQPGGAATCTWSSPVITPPRAYGEPLSPGCGWPAQRGELPRF